MVKTFKKLEAEYYTLRARTKALGLNDKDFPRYLRPYFSGEPRGEKSISGLLERIKEENQFLRLYRLDAKHNEESQKRETQALCEAYADFELFATHNELLGLGRGVPEMEKIRKFEKQ